MKSYQWLVAGVAALGLSACDSGGINLDVSTSVGDTINNNTGGSTDNNPCARYTESDGTVRRGSFDGRNCVYGPDFASGTKPILVDLRIPFIAGVHIFQDKLFIGNSIDNRTAGVTVPQDGAGPTLTIEAGNTLVWSDASDYLLINRGSRIDAQGSPTAPITLTGFTDAVSNAEGPEDVQLWGGLVINGNGITNNCTDDQRAQGTCAVVSEGQPTFYGGNNNAESSGSLRYVVIKHAGFEVATDDELNGLTLNAVCSGTVIEFVQVYSAYDDGIEWFGGAVDVSNAILTYVKDDSLDFSDGYRGTVDTALAIHSAQDSNWCIELDNIGAARSDAGQALDLAPITQPTVRKLSCILSNNKAGTHGDSSGMRIRQGGRINLENSIVYGGYGTNVLGEVGTANNRCWRPESTTTLRDMQDSTDANQLVSVKNSYFGCEVVTSGSLPNGTTNADWLLGAGAYAFNVGNTLVTNVADPANNPFQPGTFYTRAGLNAGAVTSGDDWTRPWSYGLRTGNQGQPLWFVQ